MDSVGQQRKVYEPICEACAHVYETNNTNKEDQVGYKSLAPNAPTNQCLSHVVVNHDVTFEKLVNGYPIPNPSQSAPLLISNNLTSPIREHRKRFALACEDARDQMMNWLRNDIMGQNKHLFGEFMVYDISEYSGNILSMTGNSIRVHPLAAMEIESPHSRRVQKTSVVLRIDIMFGTHEQLNDFVTTAPCQSKLMMRVNPDNMMILNNEPLREDECPLAWWLQQIAKTRATILMGGADMDNLPQPPFADVIDYVDVNTDGSLQPYNFYIEYLALVATQATMM